MKYRDLKRDFIHFFKQQNHKHIVSSPVIPHNDPSLMFVNAGMNQFKSIFLGSETPKSNRAVTIQKCIRCGGKHNDLENVGHTSRHLTFFEMLGNFSFGDYFKKEAIDFAWKCSTEVFKIDPVRIFPSVYVDDNEAFDLWTRYVPAERISRMGKKDNFWSMGPTGPCGPCSELYFDRGPSYGDSNLPADDPDGERFIEYWNLVFMQYNQHSDGRMTDLPMQCIDTGAGLERLLMLQQGVSSVFETDVFKEMIQDIESVTNVSYNDVSQEFKNAFHVIADHLRSLCFSISDGAQPSNLDRGYVLRKLVRRAVRYGKLINQAKPFLYNVAPLFIDRFSDLFPELSPHKQRIQDILFTEEESFFKTLKNGEQLLRKVCVENTNSVISGDDAFKLKDTFGMPFDEIELLAKDYHKTVDTNAFLKLEEEARQRSKQNTKKTAVSTDNIDELISETETTFVGFETLSTTSTVQQIVKLNDKHTALVCSQTPFYAEKGGQIGDQGTVTTNGTTYDIIDTQVTKNDTIYHIVSSNIVLNVGDDVQLSVDHTRRQSIMRNHSATHLLHWALKKHLGDHVQQKGSLVGPDYLRFDFSHHKAVTNEQLTQIEATVNDAIRNEYPIQTDIMSFNDVANDRSITQLFGEKYGDEVRVVRMGPSNELCGGTHVTNTASIALFCIQKRIEYCSRNTTY